jgi:hypothetical protein
MLWRDESQQTGSPGTLLGDDGGRSGEKRHTDHHEGPYPAQSPEGRPHDVPSLYDARADVKPRVRTYETTRSGERPILQADALQVDVEDHRDRGEPVPSDVRMSTLTHESDDRPFARRVGAVDTAPLVTETDAIAFAEQGEVGQNEIHWQLRDQSAARR